MRREGSENCRLMSTCEDGIGPGVWRGAVRCVGGGCVCCCWRAREDEDACCPRREGLKHGRLCAVENGGEEIPAEGGLVSVVAPGGKCCAPPPLLPKYPEAESGGAVGGIAGGSRDEDDVL